MHAGALHRQKQHGGGCDLDGADAGLNRAHTEKFYRREREFPSYRRARRWEEENLARFLR